MAERRNFELELWERNQPTAPPAWPIKFSYKLFRIYDCPYPSYNQTAPSRPKMSPSGTPEMGTASVLLPIATPNRSGQALVVGRHQALGGGIAPFAGIGGGGLPPIHPRGGGGEKGVGGETNGSLSKEGLTLTRRPSASATNLRARGHGRGKAEAAQAEGNRAVSTSLALKVEVIKGDEIPRMDSVAVNSSQEGCDPFVVLR